MIIFGYRLAVGTPNDLLPSGVRPLLVHGMHSRVLQVWGGRTDAPIECCLPQANDCSVVMRALRPLLGRGRIPICVAPPSEVGLGKRLLGGSGCVFRVPVVSFAHWQLGFIIALGLEEWLLITSSSYTFDNNNFFVQVAC